MCADRHKHKNSCATLLKSRSVNMAESRVPRGQGSTTDFVTVSLSLRCHVLAELWAWLSADRHLLVTWIIRQRGWCLFPCVPGGFVENITVQYDFNFHLRANFFHLSSEVGDIGTMLTACCTDTSSEGGQLGLVGNI